MAQDFCCEFCEIFKNIYHTEHVRVTDSLFTLCSREIKLPAYVSLFSVFTFFVLYYTKKISRKITLCREHSENLIRIFILL